LVPAGVFGRVARKTARGIEAQVSHSRGGGIQVSGWVSEEKEKEKEKEKEGRKEEKHRRQQLKKPPPPADRDRNKGPIVQTDYRAFLFSPHFLSTLFQPTHSKTPGPPKKISDV